MNRRQKIIVSVVGIFIVLLALVGITYGYFLTRIQGNTNTTSITVTTADLKLVYGDGNNIITGTNIEPGWTTNGLNGNPEAKTFTIKNEGNAPVENFNIYLEDVINSLSRKEDLIYRITCENTTEGATSTECEDFEVVENEVNSEDELVFPSVMSIIARDTLEPATATTNAEEHTYTVTVTYKNLNIDQSEDMAKEFRAKVNIYDAKTKFLANEIMTNVRKTGTFNYNKTEYIDPSLQDGTNYTIPAHATSLENERILTYTMDDYGTSYYYRGNVEDNYVNYAGMCWRIVRIEGDGSVKLLLEDRNEQCNDKEGQDLNNNGTYFTGNWSGGEVDYDEFGYEFGYVNNGRVDFLNYTGGLADSFKTFQTTLAKKIDSSIGDTSTNEQVNNTLANKLKIDEWCYDDNVTSTNSYECEMGVCTEENYGAYTRIYTNKKPSLKCTGTKLTEFKDETDMYVGTLTADEMSFAGAYDSTNYNYYLMNTYTKDNGSYWWSLSPNGFSVESGYGFAFFLRDNGYLSAYEVDGGRYSRPAVSLKSGSVITEGEGTLEKPYVIS